MRAKASIFAVLLITGFAVSAAADPSSPSPADLAFLETLGSSPAELPDVGTPAPQWKTCTASTDCGDGNTASCTGNWSCQVTTAGVKCDNNEVQCPNFCAISMGCQCCSGWYTTTCFSRRGDCQYTNDGIACNGHELTCASTCPLCPEW